MTLPSQVFLIMLTCMLYSLIACIYYLIRSSVDIKPNFVEKLVIPIRSSAETTIAMKTGVLKRRHRDEIINSLSTLILVHTSHPYP